MSQPLASKSFAASFLIDGTRVPVVVTADLWPGLAADRHTPPDSNEVAITAVEMDGSAIEDFVSEDDLERFEQIALLHFEDAPRSYDERLTHGFAHYSNEARA